MVTALLSLAFLLWCPDPCLMCTKDQKNKQGPRVTRCIGYSYRGVIARSQNMLAEVCIYRVSSSEPDVWEARD